MGRAGKYAYKDNMQVQTGIFSKIENRKFIFYLQQHLPGA